MEISPSTNKNDQINIRCTRELRQEIQRLAKNDWGRPESSMAYLLLNIGLNIYRQKDSITAPKTAAQWVEEIKSDLIQ